MAADDKNQANNDKTTRKPGVVIPRRVTPDAKPASMPEPGDSPALVRHKARVAAAEAAQAGAPAATKAEPERIARADLAPYQTSVLNAELMKRSAETAQARSGEAAQAANASKLSLFVKYGMATTDTFDTKTGVITRGASASAPSSSATPAPAATPST